MTIVLMGLDQHRGQITAEWLDTDTGEVSRPADPPADRQGFRQFLRESEAKQVEAAVEATTGWRFVVEELRAAGHVAHLAEPGETAGLRGPKKRAKSDRADARHLRVSVATCSGPGIDPQPDGTAALGLSPELQTPPAHHRRRTSRWGQAMSTGLGLRA